MSIIFAKPYNYSCPIQEINVTKFPLVIISDPHTNIRKIRLIKEEYSHNQIICLGDITFLFAKKGDKFNELSVKYFIKNKIPCLQGNHDQLCDEYGLKEAERDYLQKLPRGFKLLLPDGSNYLCFHNRPNDLWGYTEEDFSKEDFLKTYPINDKTKAVIIGHNHRHFINIYDGIDCYLFCVGRLSKDGEYALLTENGLALQKL